ncbi:MAG: helix-turn-helix transcriptional regulator [Balneolaceae bacterium]|nr:helix-turn-helix transcriptional regulator [Balneolaceae bacterium]
MPRTYLTESEQIEHFRYFFHEIDNLVNSEAELYSMSDEMPLMIHTNDRDTLALDFVNNMTCEHVGESKEYIKQNSLELFLEFMHPVSLDYGFEVVQPKCQSLGRYEVFSYVEYYKFRRFDRYLPFVQFVKASSRDVGSVLVYTVSPDRFGATSREIEKFIEIDLFRLENFRRFQSLTDREIEVLTLLAKGFTNKEMGEIFHISTATVKTHRKNIIRKLDTGHMRDLVKYAISFDLVRI